MDAVLALQRSVGHPDDVARRDNDHALGTDGVCVQIDIHVEFSLDTIKEEKAVEADGVLDDLQHQGILAEGLAVVFDNEEVVADAGVRQEGEGLSQLGDGNGVDRIHGTEVFSAKVKKTWEFSKIRFFRPK